MMAADDKAAPFTTLRFERTFEDWLAYQMYFVGTSPTIGRRQWIRRAILLVFAAIGAGAAAITAWVGPADDGYAWATYAVAAVLCALPVFGWNAEAASAGRVYQAMLSRGELDGVLGRRELIVDVEGFSCASNDIFGRYSWRALRDVVVAGDHIFLRIGPALAEILPKRAFSSPADERRLIDFIATASGRPIVAADGTLGS